MKPVECQYYVNCRKDGRLGDSIEMKEKAEDNQKGMIKRKFG